MTYDPIDHDHYCAAHDHRWACSGACLRHEATDCGAPTCRCGERLLQAQRDDGPGLLECPLRWREAGHASIVEESLA